MGSESNPASLSADPLERAAMFQVACANGLGPATFARVLEINRRLRRSFLDFIEMSPGLRRREYGLGSRQSAALERIEPLEKALDSLEKLARARWRWFFRGEPGFPARLESSLGGRCPAGLFLRGETRLAQFKMSAVIGTRRPGDWGAKAAEAVAEALVRAGRAVVSGYADGIDRLAHHAAARRADGKTILVLSTGPRFYKPTETISRAEEKGDALVVSQFPPAAGFSTGAAMARNLTVAALSDSIIVAESGRRGGAMETAKMGEELGRPVFALTPAPLEKTFIHSEIPHGNRFLLETGASPIIWQNGTLDAETLRKQVEKEIRRRRKDLFSEAGIEWSTGAER